MVGGCVTMAMANSFEMLLLGRVASGLAVGLGFVVFPIYVAELSPSDRRGQVGSYSELFFSWGMVLAFFVSYLAVAVGLSWRFMIGMGVLPAIALTIGSVLLPESPYTHVANGRIILAAQVIRQCSIDSNIREQQGDVYNRFNEEEIMGLLHAQPHTHGPVSKGNDGSSKFEEAVQQRLHEVEQSVVESTSSSWSDVFESANKRRLQIMVGLALSQQVTGIVFIEFYCPTILYRQGLASMESSMLWTIGIGIVKLVMVYFLGRVVDGLGRRLPLIVSGIGVTVSNFGLGLAVAFGSSYSGSLQAFFVLLFAYAFVALFAFGYGPVYYIIVPEIFPTKTRARASALSTVIAQGSAFIVAMTFVSITETLGTGATFFLFGFISAVCCVYCYVYVPETKGATLEELGRRLDEGGTPRAVPVAAADRMAKFVR